MDRTNQKPAEQIVFVLVGRGSDEDGWQGEVHQEREDGDLIGGVSHTTQDGLVDEALGVALAVVGASWGDDGLVGSLVEFRGSDSALEIIVSQHA